MANTISDFYPTLVAAVAELQEPFLGEIALPEACWLDAAPVEGQMFAYLNIPVPAKATAADIGAGDPTFADVTETNHQVQLQYNITSAFIIRSFEQIKSPVQLGKFYLDPAIKACRRKVADTVASAIDNASWTATAVSNAGGTSNLISTTNFLSARATLANAGVPIDEPQNMTLVLPPTPYQTMLGDSGWSYATSTGQAIAQEIRERGQFPVAFSTYLKQDLSLNAVATGSGSTLVNHGYLMHRTAVALVGRQFPDPDSAVVKAVDVDLDGLPFRVMTSYSHDHMGWRFSVNCAVGVAQVRPEAAVQMQIKVTP